MLCFKNYNIELAKCLFATQNYSPSNLGKHIERNHSADDAPDFFKLSKSGPGKASSILQSDDLRTSRVIEVTDGNSSIRTYFHHLTSQHGLLASTKGYKALFEINTC
jgi:hypothetical protein